MEVCHQTIHSLKFITGINEYLRPARFGLNDAIFIRHGFQGSGACGTNSDNTAAVFLCFVHDCRLFRLNHVKLGVHFMLQHIVHFNRTECSQTNVQCYMGHFYAHFFDFPQQLRCKMQSCCRCCRRAFVLRINRLVSVFILQFMGDIRRQRHFAQFIQNVFKNAFIFKFDDTVAAFDDLQHFRNQFAPAKGNFIPGTGFFAGTYQHFPCIHISSDQKENFHGCACSHSFSI